MYTVNFPHTVLKSIDKGSFIDMLKTAGAGDSERTNKKARMTIVRTLVYPLNFCGHCTLKSEEGGCLQDCISAASYKFKFVYRQLH